jgi:hypothetical protein
MRVSSSPVALVAVVRKEKERRRGMKRKWREAVREQSVFPLSALAMRSD